MSKMTKKELARSLRNIGPAMAEKLVDAGIDTPEKLHALGAQEAYVRIQATGGFCGSHHVAYLWALEGAIRGCDWLDIPERTKKAHKKFLNTLKERDEADNRGVKKSGKD